jgi:PPM family protein phosphatase
VLRFSYGARSHVGLVRATNEDSGFASAYLQLVADGVGGAAAGEVASTAARPRADMQSLLAEAMLESHRQLGRGVALDASRTGMATTLTAVLTHHDRAAVAHIGDSRGYLFRAGSLTRLTSDHSLVQMLLDEGRLAEEDVATHPYRSVVMKSLDAETPPEPDVFDIELHAGDRLLVCSDGLTDLVPEAQVASLLRIDDPDDTAGALVGAALDAGGRDNVTCLVADVEEGPALSPCGLLLGAMRDPYLVVDPAAVRSAGPFEHV